MRSVYVFCADGFEEVEGLTAVDLLRRAGVSVTMVSIMGRTKIMTISSLAISLPSASKSSINLSACSVLVSVLPPVPDSSSSAVMSYSPIHEKPLSAPNENAIGLPSGAREDLS